MLNIYPIKKTAHLNQNKIGIGTVIEINKPPCIIINGLSEKCLVHYVSKSLTQLQLGDKVIYHQIDGQTIVTDILIPAQQKQAATLSINDKGDMVLKNKHGAISLDANGLICLTGKEAQIHGFHQGVKINTHGHHLEITTTDE